MSFSKYITAAILCSAAGAYAASPPGQIQTGQVANCDRWDLVVSGESCQIVVDRTPDITLDEFLSWNRGAGANCLTLWAEYYACTRAPPAPLGDVQPGQPATCNRWHLVAAGDTCQSVAGEHSDITLEQFLAWNPAAQPDCSTLFAGFYACTGAPANAPANVQPGQAVNCNSWHLVKPGDTCETIVGNHPGLTLEQVLAWNAGVGPDCKKLWDGYYACSGVTPAPSSASPSTPSPSAYYRAV